MNKFFKSAVDRYNNIMVKHKPNGFLINPISSIDSEIIGELKIILAKLNCIEVVEILKNYKEYKDEEIRDSLLDWNIKNKKFLGKIINTESDSEEVEKEIYPAFFELENLILRDYDILGVEILEVMHNDPPFEITYCIKLNPTPEDAKRIPLFANRIVAFKDEEDRDSAIENLKSFLTERGFLIVKL